MRLSGSAKATLSALLVVALVVGLWVQRSTLADAIDALGGLTGPVVALLVVLAIIERVSRAVLIRSLLPDVSLGRAEVMSDVGAAINKGIPLGGPVATLVRWQIARAGGVAPIDFTVMLIATGVATAFVSWAYPLAATVIDASTRAVTLTDTAIIGLCAAVLLGSFGFWVIVLRSDRTTGWLLGRSEWVSKRFGAIVPALDGDTGARTFTAIVADLRRIARRPWRLLVYATVAQGVGAVVLWVCFVGVGVEMGVGSPLSVPEFARVFFVAHILGSLAPTPGGVGVVEAGLTGSMIAAGVDAGSALAGVLIYRFITYLLPIIVGTMMYLVWQRSPRLRVPPERVEFSSEAVPN